MQKRPPENTLLEMYIRKKFILSYQIFSKLIFVPVASSEGQEMLIYRFRECSVWTSPHTSTVIFSQYVTFANCPCLQWTICIIKFRDFSRVHVCEVSGSFNLVHAIFCKVIHNIPRIWKRMWHWVELEMLCAFVHKNSGWALWQKREQISI